MKICSSFFLITFIVLLNLHVNAQSLNIYIAQDTIYSKDTVRIKVKNKDHVSQYYLIGLEIYYENKWREVEPDVVHMRQKAELWDKLQKLSEKSLKITLPNYFNDYLDSKNSFRSMRFKIHYGNDIKNTKIVYTKPIVVIKR